MRCETLPAGLVAIALSLTPASAFAATTERPDEALRALLIEAIAQPSSFDDRFHAEVWLTDMASRLAPILPDLEERIEILRRVHFEARRVELDPELVLAVIQVESNFDRFAISRSGAQGLMQIMPFWLDEIGRPGDNLFHIPTNLRLGCTILKYYLDQEGGHVARALARYNGSAGESWYPMRVFKALRTRWYSQ